VGYWADNVTIWEHTAQVTERNWFAESSMAGELKKRGLTQASVEHYFKALAIEPNDGDSNLAVALHEHEAGHLRECIPYYERYLAKVGNGEQELRYQVLGNLGHVYRRLGDIDRARQYFEQAAKLGKPIPTQ
jgi:tetratricopeptide (TPR) repeat protein